MARSTVTEKIAERQKKAPVKIVSLAHDLGLKVYVSDTLGSNVSGMIRRDSDRGGDSGYAIFVNASHAETRRRFTIAHEVAHYILHEDLIGDGIVEDALLRADGFSNSLERQANAMAANLLMPWHLIDRARSEGVQTIEALASDFQVSKDAMSYRILGVPYSESLAIPPERVVASSQ